MHARNFAHMTTTHVANVSAHLLWMDFAACSMIHFSRSMVNFIRVMHSNSHNRGKCTSVCMLYNTALCSRSNCNATEDNFTDITVASGPRPLQPRYDKLKSQNVSVKS